MIIQQLKDFFGENSVFVSLCLLGIALIAALIFHFIFFRILKAFVKRSENKTFEILVEELEYPILFLVIIISLLGSMPYLTLDKDIVVTLKHIISILIIVAVAWSAINAVDVARVIILKRYDVDSKDNLEARKVYTQFRVLEQIVVVIIIIIAIATALMTFEKIRELGVSLLASAGVIGIIIGFAAQKSIATILAGFQIAITQPIRLDDVVIVEGEWGRIEEITLTYVVVRIWDQRRLIVPITYFIEKTFQNWTRVSADILGTVFIYTDYTVPVEKLREELTKLLEASEYWDKKVNVIQVTDATDKTVEVRALMSAADSSAAWNLRVYVREKLIAYLQENYPKSLPRTRIELENENKPEKERV